MLPSIQSLIIHLNRLVRGFRLGKRDQLHCRCSPPSLEAYIPWLARSFRLESIELLYASVYLERLRLTQQRPRGIQRCTPHRLVLAAIVVAHKYLRDSSYWNIDWRRGLQLPKEEMDMAERAMLRLLGWRLRVSTEELQDVKRSLPRLPRYLEQSTRKRTIGLAREDAVTGTPMYEDKTICWDETRDSWEQEIAV